MPLYPEETDKKAKELLTGAIDAHVHSGPSIFPRSFNDHEVASQAEKAGMKAILLKAHEGTSVIRAQLAKTCSGSLEVYGGHVMNIYSGGLNPYAVDLELKLGAKLIWMPTISAANHLAYYGGSSFTGMKSSQELMMLEEGICILDKNDNLLPKVETVLELISAAGICIGTGHLSAKEIEVLCDKAFQIGANKVLVNHPDMAMQKISLSKQKEMSNRGAIMEKTMLSLHAEWGVMSPGKMAEGIKIIGAESCILTSDYGQSGNPSPHEGLQKLISLMLQEGVKEEEIEIMTKRNPTFLLGMT